MMELENLVLAYNLQFFAKDGPGGEKTEPATSKKLDDVRKEGQAQGRRDPHCSTGGGTGRCVRRTDQRALL